MKPDLPEFLSVFRGTECARHQWMVACFEPDAAVHDEGRDIVGTDAVRAWKQETSVKYRITAEPLE